MYLGIHFEMPFGIIPPPRANGALSQCLIFQITFDMLNNRPKRKYIELFLKIA